MDTENLRLFVLAAERLNIGAAGRKMGMAPAVASARLAKLEGHLGVSLLHRSTRKVALSLDGAEFLPYAREILAQEDAARAALGQGGSTAAGKLRFAAPSTFAQLYIVPLLAEFLHRHPQVDLDLRLSDISFDLIEGSFDLALRNARLKDSNHKARKLSDDRRILCASPGYLNRAGTPLHPDDLSSHQLIAFRDQSPKRLVSGDREPGWFDPQLAGCRLVVDDGASQKAATVAGVGISMNSLWSVYREVAQGSLIRVLPRYEVDDPVALWLVYPNSNVLTTKVRVFIDYLLDKIGRNPPWDRS